jgi:hypothetical protein
MKFIFTSTIFWIVASVCHAQTFTHYAITNFIAVSTNAGNVFFSNSVTFLAPSNTLMRPILQESLAYAALTVVYPESPAVITAGASYLSTKFPLPTPVLGPAVVTLTGTQSLSSFILLFIKPSLVRILNCRI